VIRSHTRFTGHTPTRREKYRVALLSAPSGPENEMARTMSERPDLLSDL